MIPLALETVWIVSITLQWLVIAALLLVVLALVRQVGALSERLGGSAEPGTQSQLGLGSRLPRQIPLIGGGSVGAQGDPILLVWHEPGCEGCRVLEPHLLDVASSEAPGSVLLVSSARTARAAREAGSTWSALPIASEAELPSGLDAPRVPWGVAVTADGHVAARGRPQTAQDLREMLAAARSAELVAGPDSVRRHPWGESLPYWEDADPERREARALRGMAAGGG